MTPESQVDSNASNLDIVRCIYDAYEEGDLRMPADYFSDEIEGYVSDFVPWGGKHFGRAGIRDGLRILRQYIETAFEPSEFIDCGDYIVTVGQTTGFVHKTGATFSVRTVHVWRFVGGKIVRFENYLDRAQSRVFEMPARAG